MTLQRALGYPYDIPSTSYVLEGEKVCPWRGEIDLSTRLPVLACGSNQSPTQLLRKFGPTDLPVMAGWLQDYDSVYSAHFTSYGSIAATYHYEKGVRSRQMITWLDQDQLEVMHQTESLGENYEFVEMDNLHFHSDCHQRITTAHSYNSLLGPFRLDALPIAIRAITAVSRPYPALDQEELQKKVIKKLGYDLSVKEFIEENINDAKVRKKHREWLIKTSHSS
ncbi:conserved hypothetical protein [Candidatus Terasakiella magnetica]|uniref:Uncharacterized protein n=1 Tax=Candidatus Terasakiella magnetica TaxID=1867952 RepID=A0A1C3REZ9_9PROT|nr:hypothetical protein [Candidatus Terasakiella magnetica]SCA55863.1 conserved hypothetical protein [Candidatus Terasakiella magnetica]